MVLAVAGEGRVQIGAGAEERWPESFKPCDARDMIASALPSNAEIGETRLSGAPLELYSHHDRNMENVALDALESWKVLQTPQHSTGPTCCNIYV